MTGETHQQNLGARGALSAIKEGIKAGRDQARKEREERARATEQYARENPSEYGKKIGQAVEKAQPIIRPAARAAEQLGHGMKRMGGAAKDALILAAKESQKRQNAANTLTPTTRKASRKTSKKATGKATRRSGPAPVRRQPLDPLGGLDGMLIGSAPAKKKGKKRKQSNDDYYGLGGDFRLL